MAKRCLCSPSEVSQDEFVAFGVYSPELLDQRTGQITPEALQTDKLLQTPPVDDCGNSSGISVARIGHEPAIKELADNLRTIVEKPRKDGTFRKSVGFASIGVDELTAIGIETLDDGWEKFRTHAVLRSGKTRAELRGVRKNLLTKLNTTLTRWEQIKPSVPAQ